MGLFNISLLLVSLMVLAIFHSCDAQNSPQDYLEVHNNARAQVGVGPMTWDAGLASRAQNYANSRTGDCNLIHSGPGENLAKGGGDFTGRAAVELWVSEKPNYNHGTNQCASEKVYTLLCRSRNYDFLFRASGIEKSGMFNVRELLPEYTCPIKDKIYPKLHTTSKLIGGIVKLKFKSHKRKYSPSDIKSDMKKDMSMDLTYIMCWRAKEQALEELRGKPSASYGKLAAYIHVMNTSYPDSHIRMKKNEDNEFLYVFTALTTFIQGFNHCRLIIVVDASHLRGLFAGTFVAACTMDGAGHIFRLTYGVLDSKNDASWT